MKKDSSLYVQEMIQNFRMPGTDCLTECMLSPDSNTHWDSGVFISTGQSKKFYKDIFHFWVRALFCFVENMACAPNSLPIESFSPFVKCQQISSEEFRGKLSALVSQHIEDQSHRGTGCPKFQIELQKRSFSKSYMVLNDSNFESSVAESDGEYVAYFHRIKNCPLLTKP